MSGIEDSIRGVESEITTLVNQERIAQQAVLARPDDADALHKAVTLQTAIQAKRAALAVLRDVEHKLDAAERERGHLDAQDQAADAMEKAIELGNARSAICEELDATFDRLDKLLVKLSATSAEAYEHHKVYVGGLGLAKAPNGMRIPLETRRNGWECIHPDLTAFVHVMVQRFDKLTRKMNRGAIVQFHYTESSDDTFAKTNKGLMQRFSLNVRTMAWRLDTNSTAKH